MSEHISVCIPVYNAEKYIGLTIKSALNQTYKNFELIIIDNKSTDNTLKVIKEFKDERIRIVENQKNIGAKGNWNKALQEAKYEYIKILPADDLLYPKCLEKQINVFSNRNNRNVVMVNSVSDIINDNGKKILKRNISRWNGVTSGKIVIKKNVLCGTNIIGEPGSVMFKKSISERTGVFDDSFGYVIDLDYWVRMLLSGDLYTISDTLCAFRISANSWSTNIRQKQATDFKGFIDKLYKDKTYNISIFEYLVGNVMVKVNETLRRIFYIVFL
jgi:glycosyltransferase involved in cell wall biosynthesis